MYCKNPSVESFSFCAAKLNVISGAMVTKPLQIIKKPILSALKCDCEKVVKNST